MPKPGTKNVLYVLYNGQANEWALARDVPDGEDPDEVFVARFGDVPDDLADEITKFDSVSQVWDRVKVLPNEAL